MSNKVDVSKMSTDDLLKLNLTANLLILQRIQRVEDLVQTLANHMGFDINRPDEKRQKIVQNFPELSEKLKSLMQNHFA